MTTSQAIGLLIVDNAFVTFVDCVLKTSPQYVEWRWSIQWFKHANGEQVPKATIRIAPSFNGRGILAEFVRDVALQPVHVSQYIKHDAAYCTITPHGA